MRGLQDVERDVGSIQDIGGTRSTGFTRGVATEPLLGETGRPWPEIRARLTDRKRSDYDWRNGRIPIYVYYDGEDLLEVQREAYNQFFSENALGQRAFPSLAGMEEEVIQQCLALFTAPAGADGSFTSGGTESLFLACKTARDRYRRLNPSSRGKLNIVLSRTAHPALDKAAHYLDLAVRRTKATWDHRADLRAIAGAIDNRTIMIVGSAPCYPFGVFDPIRELGELAKETGVWLHVDACLGGFLAPFARQEGFEIPPFDFAVEGVNSLSADLHKFGYCARGASVILYRTAELKSHQAFHFDDWDRGSYSTETAQGSRAGGAVASAWAVMQFLGRSGYRRLAKKIMSSALQLRTGINQIEGLEVLLPSELNIVAYRSIDTAVDIHAVGEVLNSKGWFVGRLRNPPAIHLALNAVHAPIIDQYLSDLRVAVDETRASGLKGRHDDVAY